MKVGYSTRRLVKSTQILYKTSKETTLNQSFASSVEIIGQKRQHQVKKMH